jgi:hypothetical protein
VFSFKKSSWGGYYLGYSLIALLLGIMGLLSFIRLIKSGDRAQLSHLVTVSAACFAAVVSFVVNVYLFDPGTAVRYSIPVLIPVASVTLMMPWIKQHTPQAHSQNGTKQLIGINAPGVTLILAVVLISGLGTSGTMRQRLANLRQIGFMLSSIKLMLVLRFSQ